MKNFLYKLFIEETINTKLQFIRYLFVGGFAAVVNMGSLFLLTELLRIHYLIANILGFLLGLVVNYILSRLLVFSKEKSNNQIFEFITYAIIGVIGLGFDTLLMWLGTGIVGMYYMISKVISTGIVFIWNFVARKILYVLIDRNSNKKIEEKI